MPEIVTLTPKKAAQKYGAAATLTPAGRTNGTVTALDGGQSVINFGSTPLRITSGALVHTPAGTNSAGYMEFDIGERVHSVRVRAAFPSTLGATVAVVVPDASWATAWPNTVPVAGCHFTITRTGWSYGVFLGSADSIVESEAHGLPQDIVQEFTVAFDDIRSVAWVTRPDGTVEQIADDRIRDNIGTKVVLELFESNGATTQSARILGAWVNDRAVDHVALGKAVQGDAAAPTAQALGSAKLLNDTLDWTIPTTDFTALPTVFNLPVTIPASGKMLASIDFNVSGPLTEVSPGVWKYVATTADDYGILIQPLVNGVAFGSRGLVRTPHNGLASPGHWAVEGTPGAATLSWKAWAFIPAVIHVGAQFGSANVAAIPLA